MVYVMWLSTPAAAGPWAKMFSLLGIWHDIHVIAQNNNSDIVFNLFYFRFSLSYFSLFCFWIPSTLERRSVALRCRPGQVRPGSKSVNSKWNGQKRRRSRRRRAEGTASVGNLLALTVRQKSNQKVSAWHMSFSIQMNSLSTCDGAYFMASNRNEYGWGFLPLSLSPSHSLSAPSLLTVGVSSCHLTGLLCDYFTCLFHSQNCDFISKTVCYVLKWIKTIN